MNSRERMLLIALVAIVGGGGFLIGTYVWFVKPLVGYNKTITTMRDENNLEQEKWDNFMRERKKLELAKLKSLPFNPGDAASEYVSYLERMVAQTGLKLNGITPSQATRMKPIAPVAGVKDVGHTLMTFTLNARGDLADLLKFMELLQATPYEHRVKSLNVDRADTGAGQSASRTLVINIVIETLLVAKTENRPGHPPGVDPRYIVCDYISGRSMEAPMGWGLIGSAIVQKVAAPTPADRDYDGIARKNIFVGWISSTPPPPPPPPPPPAARAPGNIPAFIRLVQTVPTHQEAYLSNLFYKNQEIKFDARPNSGYQVQRIADENGDYIFFFMKVLRVDSGMMHFQIENHVFTIKLGQTLADAIQHPLSLDRMDDLDLDWDRAWAREQMAEESEEKKQDKKVTGKKSSKKTG